MDITSLLHYYIFKRVNLTQFGERNSTSTFILEDLSLSHSTKESFKVHHRPHHFLADQLCAAASEAPCSAWLLLRVPFGAA